MPGQTPNIRPPAVAGQFYPSEPSELRLQVADMLERAPDACVEGEILGLMAPHAGYPYSGQAAASAYRQIRGDCYDLVVVMAPSHQEACNGISIFPGDGYGTPLGTVPVSREVTEGLAREDASLHLSMAGHGVQTGGGLFNSLRGEHALEVQVPFLQVALAEFSIIPIVMDCRSIGPCRRLADALARVLQGKRVLLVASSDLYHGHDYDACGSTDARTLEDIAAFNPEQLAIDLEAGLAQACGGGPITALMLAARQMGADSARVVCRTNSNDVLGERGGYVVGYGAALFCKAGSHGGRNTKLLDADRVLLGRIARDAVRSTICGRTPETPELLSPALRGVRGAFVTLHCGGKLRGCIGDIHGHEPLGITVQDMAVAAATRDPRFPPLSKDELADLEIEISVLSPMRQVTAASEVDVGRHGLWIRQGAHQGILLPQVAVEQGWDRTQFLSHACRKAQLPPTAWQHPDTEISIFSADVFPA